VTLRVWRKGEVLEIRVVLGAMPKEIEVARYRRLLYEQFGLALRDGSDGPAVAMTDEEGAAVRAGLRAGDVLAAVGGAPVSDADGVVGALMKEGLFMGRGVGLTVRRDEGAASEQRELTLRAVR